VCCCFRDSRKILNLCGLWLLFIVIMLAWRFGLGACSSRYWAILTIPGILFGIVFCYLNFWGRRISAILVGILCICCLIQDLHFNRNSRYILNAAKAIAADAKHYPRTIIWEDGNSAASRLGYYSGIPTLSDHFSSAFLERNLQGVRGLYDVVYLVFTVSREENPQSILPLKELRAELLFEQFHDNREKKKLYIYRVPVEPALSMRHDIEPFSLNGNFETLRPQAKTERIFPLGWRDTGVGTISGSCQPVASTISKGNALAIQSVLMLTLYPETRGIVKQDGFLVFSVKQAKDSQIWVWAMIYDKKVHPQRKETVLHTCVNTDALHQFQIPLNASEFAPEESVRFYWTFIAPAGLQLDDIGFCPRDIAGKSNSAQKQD